MATLTDPQRHFIVTRLACFKRPIDVIDEVRETFGVEVTRQQLDYYRADREYGKPLADRWVKIWEATRKKFLDEISSIPIAHEAYRLRVLQEELQKQLKRGDRASPQLVLEMLEQAAKERGGKFTNQQLLEHSGEIEGGGDDVHIYLPSNGRGDAPEQIRNRMKGLQDAGPSGNGAKG